MEWVETTGKSLDEAKDRALDQLGVAADEAEFDVLDEPRTGLFGRVRGEARVRARVKPTAVRPKQDRRSRGRGKGRRDDQGGSRRGGRNGGRSGEGRSGEGRDGGGSGGEGRSNGGGRGRDPRNGAESSGGRRSSGRSQQSQQQKETPPMDDQDAWPTVTPQEVGDAAVAFMSGLADAFGVDATTSLRVDDTDLDVRVEGTELGLMVGPGGRTLMAVQDLARVASQRRLGDHDTRLRIDVGGYREKRRAALEKFALAVANQVAESGEPKALEPMPSADRKAVHDALADVDTVTSRSEGDDPMRRVVISPA
jgi:spoIIIJ-associated protein